MKGWDNLKENWGLYTGMFASFSAVFTFVFNLWFDSAVDARIQAAGLLSQTHLTELRSELESLHKELEAGRIKGDIEANASAVQRIEGTLVRIDDKIGKNTEMLSKAIMMMAGN